MKNLLKISEEIKQVGCFGLLWLVSLGLMGYTMVPMPKSEEEKPIGTIAIERDEGDISYLINVNKEPDYLLVELEVSNKSSKIIEIIPEIIHAAESEYVLRYVPLVEMLANYRGQIDYEKLRFQNAQQYAVATRGYSLDSTTSHYGNYSYTQTRVSPAYDLSNVAFAIIALNAKNNIARAQEKAQTLINISLAPSSLLPNTKCKGIVIFERKKEEKSGPVRIDLIFENDIKSFNFIDPPYFGIDESESPVIKDLDPQGSLMLAGFKKGDKILSLEGVPVSSLKEFATEGRRYSVGQTVTVEFQRHRKVKKASVTLIGFPY